MATATTAKPVAKAASSTSPVFAKFNEMAASIPDGGDETVTVKMLQEIDSATTPTTLGDFWETTKARQLLGHVLVVNSLKKRPSTYKGGLNFFLVCTVTDQTTGEQTTLTTSSVAVAGQLVKAYAEGWLPLKCEIVQSEKPTASGFYPQHLRVYGKGGDF